MQRHLISSLFLTAFLASLASAETRTWRFDDLKPGAIPAQWKTMSAWSSAGRPIEGDCPAHATFEAVGIAGPSGAAQGNQALKLTRKSDAIYDDGHHCWTKEVNFTNGTISADVRAEDTAKGHCGLAFRIQDHKNYYAVRYSIVQGDLALVRVKNGQAVWDKAAKVSTGDAKGAKKWFNLKVEVTGNTIVASIDGKPLLRYTDADPLTAAGGIGLFSRGNESVVLWDNLTVATN